ncbi:Protein of unknown function [Gryllus bimaculatus]|nr:Protein of unknown function [Gryllus bimaculatus]
MVIAAGDVGRKKRKNMTMIMIVPIQLSSLEQCGRRANAAEMNKDCVYSACKSERLQTFCVVFSFPWEII